MNSLAVAHNEASRVQWHTEALWLDQAAVMILLARRKTDHASGLFRECGKFRP
jgi:hypothetical protein